MNGNNKEINKKLALITNKLLMNNHNILTISTFFMMKMKENKMFSIIFLALKIRLLIIFMLLAF